MKDRIKFYENLAHKNGSVMTYKMMPVSIANTRKGELNKASASRFSPDTTFQNMFGNRLNKMQGQREKVQITINADVENMIGDKSMITRKSYGPFSMKIPKLETQDMYKLMIYTLLQNNFSILSTQTIASIGAQITTHNEQFFRNHKAGAHKISAFFLDKQFPIKLRGDNTCMIDFVWHHCRNKKGFKSYC